LKLTDILGAEGILAGMRAATKEAALKELAELASKTRPGLPAEEAFRAINERERIGTTGIGDGIAIPHGKTPRVKSCLGCLAVSRVGIDFAALDGRKTYIFFLLLSPEGEVRPHLKALARITRVLRDPALRQALVEAPGAAEVYGLLSRADSAL
jgi:nitrogen PTS system EIIA component